MHHCFNVVTGNGAAVLIRGAEPVEGFQPGARGDGPGRLAKLMNITREHNARPLDGPPLFLAEGTRVERPKKAARIGVDYAGVWAKRLLRFYDPASRHVSRGR